MPPTGTPRITSASACQLNAAYILKRKILERLWSVWHDASYLCCRGWGRGCPWLITLVPQPLILPSWASLSAVCLCAATRASCNKPAINCVHLSLHTQEEMNVLLYWPQSVEMLVNITVKLWLRAKLFAWLGMLPKSESCTGMSHAGEVSSSLSAETLMLSSVFWKAEIFFCMTEKAGGAFNATSEPRPLSEWPEFFESLNLDLKLALVLKRGRAMKYS